MRDPERIDRILATLGGFWKRYPDMRLGQIVRLAAKAAGSQGDDVFEVEDGLVEQGLLLIANGSPEEGDER